MNDILLSVPTRGQIGWATVTRLEEIRDATPGLTPIHYQAGNLSVALTRNKIVNHFLSGPWQVLAMVDDDIVPPPSFLDLRAWLPEYALLAVPHPMPNPNDPSSLILTAFDETGEGLTAANIGTGVNECDAVATGCVLINREALTALGPNPFRIENDPAAGITSDDFLFCRDLKAAGLKVGYFFDGWYADHHTTISLAPLMERARAESNPRRLVHVP